MARRRKRYKRIVRPRKRLPTMFQCPLCGYVALSVHIDRKHRRAFIVCGNPSCKFKCVVNNVPDIFREVDVYGKVVDAVSKGNYEYCHEYEEVEVEES